MEPTKQGTSTRGNTVARPRFCRAVYSFQQVVPYELSLSVGDVVQVLGEEKPGWWRGRIGNLTGVFPSRCVEPIDSLEAPPVLPAQPGTSSSLKQKPGSPSKNTVTPNKSPSSLSRKKSKSSDSSPTVQPTEVSEDVSLEHEGTQGTGIDGVTYHLRLLAVHLLNAIDTLPQFRLGAEVSQRITGKFDDICLIYNDADLNKKSLLIQVKHKESKDEKICEQTLTSEKENKFSINSYFYSYLKSVTSNQLGEIESLVLYTNADSHILNREVVDVTSSVNPLLRINNMSGKFYRFTETFMLNLKDQLMKFTLENVAKDMSEYLQRGKEKNNYMAETSYNKIVSSFVDAAFKMNENNEICDLKKGFCEATGIWSEGPGKLFRNMLLKSIPLNKLQGHLKKHTRYITIHSRNIHKLDSLGDILDEDIEKFSQLFILATNQPSLEELEIVIKDKLAQKKELNSFNVNIVYGLFMDQITTWYRQKKRFYLNNNEILTKISLYLTSQQLIRNPLGLVFNEECLETLRQLILACEERVLHVTTGSHRDLVVLKISKALESKEDVQIIDANSFSKLDDTAIDIICNKIIIICLDRDEDLQKLDPLKSNKFSKLIILQDLDAKVICDFFFPKQVLHVNVDVFFADLSEDSKEIFTSKECITFQGNSISVKDLMAKLEIEGCEVLDVALNHYCSDNSISIGYSMGNDSDLLPKIISDLDIEISSDQLQKLLMRKNIFVLFDIFDDKPKTIERLSNILNKSISDIENMQNANFEREKDFNDFLRSPKAPKNKIIYFVRTSTDNCLKIKRAYNPNLYIERKLVIRQTVLVSPLKLFEALRNMSPDIAVIISNTENLEKFSAELRLNNVQVRQLVEDGRLSLVEGTDGRGAFLAKTERFITVHWFEKKSSKFVWRCTEGGLDFVRDIMKHFDKEDSDSEQNSSKFERDDILNTDNEPEEISCKESNFVDMINQSSMENRIVVISDDPGKGKSTTLSSFSRRYMELGSHWVIRVNFKEHTFREGLVKLHTQTLTTESVAELLSCINRLNINHPLGRHLLTVCLRNKESALNKLIFMLDGFDEVPPKIMEKAKILIRFLKEETQSIVFVTTRKHYTTTLEDLCSVFSTRFRKLTEESIVLYIKEFFAAHLKQSIIDNQNYGINDSFIRDYDYDFETYLRNHIEILNFPLHLNITCNIFSNIKQNSDIFFDSFVYPSAFSILKEYIKIKVESCGEKSDLPLQTYSDPDVFVKQCHEFLGKLALTEIFPELQISGDFVAELAGIKHRFLLLGIVQEDFYSGFNAQEKENSKFSFIHRTFCEYYCAHFIFNNITNQTYKDMLMPVLDKIIEGQLDKEYSMLKQFLNSFFTEPFPILNGICNRRKLDHVWLQYDENVKDLLGRTPLHYAAMYGDEFTIHKLLDNGWVHTVDITGRLPMHFQQMIVFKSFINKWYHLSPFSSPMRFFNRNIINSSSSVRSRIRPYFYNGKNFLEDSTSNVNTSLIICVNDGNLPLLKYLCDSDNTNINEPNNEGKTPLHVAAELGRYNMVRYLVDRGADVNSRDDESKSPLDYAMQIYTYTEYINCVKFLFLECGATTTAMSSRDSQVLRDVLTADVNGKNLDSLLTEPFVSKHSHLRKYLQFLGARESLLLAVGCAIPDYSKQILNAVNPRFLISTEYICKTIKRSEAEDILKSILQCTNTPNCDLTGNTWEYSPLHFLAYIGDLYQIESLLKNGAKYNVVNRNGHTPAQVCRNHHHENFGYLRVVEELFKCCNNDDSTRFKEIYKVNSLVFARDSRGRTLLHTAFEAGCVDLVKVILYKWNEDTEFLNATDDNGQTALHCASKMGDNDIVLQLLKQCVNSMCKDRYGRLPADLIKTESTAISAWRQLCRLFDYYSNGFSDGDEAMSIIDGIQSQGEIPHYLMNIRDGDDNTLLEYAVRNGHLRVVIYILSNGGNYEVGSSLEDYPVYEIRRLFKFISNAFNGIFFDLVVYADTEHSVKKCILNARNNEGDTLLHCVNDTRLAGWLVANCENINIKDANGKTPLQRAEERNDSRMRNIITNEVDRRLPGPNLLTHFERSITYH